MYFQDSSVTAESNKVFSSLKNNTIVSTFNELLDEVYDLNKVFSQISGSVFSDVDFVVADEERIIFVECKNSNLKGVINP